jgi:hypothetical protein
MSATCSTTCFAGAPTVPESSPVTAADRACEWLLVRARLYARLGWLDRAEALLLLADLKSHGHRDVRAALAGLFLARGDLRRCLATLDALGVEDPTMFRLRCKALYRLDLVDQARQLYRSPPHANETRGTDT